MANKDLKIGDRVILSPTSRHAIKGSTHNPINVLGTVDFWYLEKALPSVCRVNWDNGEWNSYQGKDNDLILQQIGDPDPDSHTLNTMRW